MRFDTLRCGVAREWRRRDPFANPLWKTEGTSPFQGLAEQTSALLATTTIFQDDNHHPCPVNFCWIFFLTLAQNKKRRFKTFLSLGKSCFIKRVQKEVKGNGEPKVEDLGPQ